MRLFAEKMHRENPRNTRDLYAFLKTVEEQCGPKSVENIKRRVEGNLAHRTLIAPNALHHAIQSAIDRNTAVEIKNTKLAKRVDELLAMGYDPKGSDPKGSGPNSSGANNIPLHAALRRPVILAKMLDKYPMNAAHKPEGTATLLHMAAYNNHSGAIPVLLARMPHSALKKNVNIWGESASTPLEAAVMHDRLASVRALLRYKNAKVKNAKAVGTREPGKNARIPLQAAVVRAISVKMEANRDAANPAMTANVREQRRVQRLALSKLRHSIVEALLAADPGSARVDDEAFVIPLHVAIKFGDTPLVRILVKADPGSIFYSHDKAPCPLFYAMNTRGLAMVDAMLDTFDNNTSGKKSVVSTDRFGFTPLHMAMILGKDDIAQSILKRDLERRSLKMVDVDGMRPTDYGLKTPNSRLMKNLARIPGYFRGAIFRAIPNPGPKTPAYLQGLLTLKPECALNKDGNGRTALHLITRELAAAGSNGKSLSHWIRLAKIIIRAAPESVNAVDKNGRRPLDTLSTALKKIIIYIKNKVLHANG